MRVSQVARLELGPKFAKASEGQDISLLHHVFRFAVIVHDAAGHTIEPPVVTLHDLPEGLAVPLQGQAHEVRIAKRLKIAIAPKLKPGHGVFPVRC